MSSVPNGSDRRTYPMHPGARRRVESIFEGIDGLKRVYRRAFKKPDGKFPIDGRLVGDIGEAIAHFDYGVELHEAQRRGSDGTYKGKDVEVKATFQDKITFTKAPVPGILVLCFQLHEDGRYTEVYNGPSEKPRGEYWDRDFTKQRRPTVARLQQLSAKKPTRPRIPRI